MHSRLSIWPRFEAAAVCTRAVWFSSRMVSTMPSTVIGLTNEDAPSAAWCPRAAAGTRRGGHARYCAYIAPPATATVLPSSAWRRQTSRRRPRCRRPRCPPASACRRALRARMAAAGSGTVTTGPVGRAAATAAVTSAPASSRPRSEGLIGAASTRTSTSSGPGAGTSTVSRDSSTVWSGLTSDCSCRAVAGISAGIR